MQYIYKIRTFYKSCEGANYVLLSSPIKISQDKFEQICSKTKSEIVERTGNFVYTDNLAKLLVENYGFKYYNVDIQAEEII
jgi:hypothetical protein